MFEPDLVLREKVYRKLGWDVWHSHTNSDDEDYYYWGKDGQRLNDIVFLIGDHADEVCLPSIETDWQVTAEYLVKFMREKGWKYYIDSYKVFDKYTFAWQNFNLAPNTDLIAEIINDNISKAACEAFLEVEL